MRYAHTVEIDAPPAAVWGVIADVERWPEWTPTMRRVQLLDAEALGPGVRARIWQPRVPSNVWQVTEIVPGERFTWESRAIASRTVAGHEVEADGERSRVTLSIETRGRLAFLSDWFIGWFSRRWVPQEAAGLKRWCEGGGV
jgi:uncharacterized membrane protein